MGMQESHIPREIVVNAYERYTPACLGEQNWGMARLGHIPATCGWGIYVAAFPQGWFCSWYSGAVPPTDATTGLQVSCCCWVWVGMAILRGTQAFRNALASPGHFWRPMAEHGLHKTLYNVFLPYNQPKPGEQPLLHLGVHPWRNSDPRLSFIWAILFNHPSWKSRAG